MRALICGAGIAGLTLARMLGGMGWDVRLIERAPALRGEGYMIDFFGPGFDAAENLGLLPRLRDLAYTVTELSYVDSSGKPRAVLNYRRMVEALDGRLLSLLRGDLALALHDGLGARVTTSHGCSVQAVDEGDDHVSVALTDGTHWSGDLVIGADGIHSTIRRLVFGPDSAYLRYLGFHTAAYIFSDHQLRQRLGDQFAMTDSVDKSVGLYAIRDGQNCRLHRAPDPRSRHPG